MRQAEEVDQHRKPEDAEDDRGDRRQVGDVDFDKIREAVLGGELLQVDRRGDTERQR
ncbi:hypothetical protein D3C87_2204180 [compost metagenome]